MKSLNSLVNDQSPRREKNRGRAKKPPQHKGGGLQDGGRGGERCGRCNGSGYRTIRETLGPDDLECPACGGSGTV